MPPGDLAPVLVTSLISVAIAVVVILRGPVGRALARRIEGASALPDAAALAAVDELQGRVAELELQVGRMHELEERLDFTERLLARGRDEAARIEGPG